MKKVLATSSVLLGVVFLAGCGHQPVNQTQPTTPAPVAQTPTTNQPVSNIPVTNDSSAMKTYSSQKYGFSLSYPGNYKIKETNYEQEPQPGGVIHVVQLGDESVTDLDVDFEKGIMVYVAKIEKGSANGTDSLAAPNGMDPVSQKDTMLDGQKARIYNNGEVYTVAKNGYEYLMILGSEANQVTKDNFAKIATSFKFTATPEQIIYSFLKEDVYKKDKAITILKSNDNFILANIGAKPGATIAGYMLWAAKTSGEWKNISETNGNCDKKLLTKYSFPQEWIAEYKCL